MWICTVEYSEHRISEQDCRLKADLGFIFRHESLGDIDVQSEVLELCENSIQQDSLRAGLALCSTASGSHENLNQNYERQNTKRFCNCTKGKVANTLFDSEAEFLCVCIIALLMS